VYGWDTSEVWAVGLFKLCMDHWPRRVLCCAPSFRWCVARRHGFSMCIVSNNLACLKKESQQSRTNTQPRKSTDFELGLDYPGSTPLFLTKVGCMCATTPRPAGEGAREREGQHNTQGLCINCVVSSTTALLKQAVGADGITVGVQREKFWQVVKHARLPDCKFPIRTLTTTTLLHIPPSAVMCSCGH
jgi:hypothetical protein